jgi:zinc transport system permease protein
MTEFLSALFNPAMPFLRNALFAGLLSSILFGVLGAVITVRRIAGLAGAISHAVLGGIGLALFVQATWKIQWFTPMAGAFLFAVLSAFIIGAISIKSKQREDTVINAVWAIGMSLGVLFMAKTPGYVDPTSYLFGNILLLSSRDLILMAGMDALIVFLAWRFYPQLVASSFDHEFAHVRGVSGTLVFLAVLISAALAIVLLQTFVGIVMLIAMLTLPSGIAAYSSRSLAGMMIKGSLLAALFSVSGLLVGWQMDMPAGASAVVIAGIVFISSAIMRHIVSRHKQRYEQMEINND